MQIGLDANNPDLALFQCFYRHGLLPVMEIVFVLQKTEVVPDKRIAFESVWGMPMSGFVAFKPLRSGKTQVKLSFSQALPDLLVDLKVGVFGVQNSLMPIFSENLVAFRSIAEAAARDPSSLPPRAEAGEREYALFDEEADIALFEEIMENLEFDEDEEDEEGAHAQESSDQFSGEQQLEDHQDRAEDEEELTSSRSARQSRSSTALPGSAATQGRSRHGDEDTLGSSSRSSDTASSSNKDAVGHLPRVYASPVEQLTYGLMQALQTLSQGCVYVGGKGFHQRDEATEES
ncbi:hypothetical protein VOLCADRAFT_106492 [Volvox carteri f. nagariensis]|uniref:Uncharacterized protein n=1 Tax=Volvox carteri f. nagariensis TaxID=3068 RepID=D8U7R1_VOLCA|nr:uncharacterized protein VOLCADRAFT_106492 [Volvox carteri f. nagariensis]EFJ44346.1 hypothetical protein VOLCADRAFT_106492 [Volvox carteri f. nagariensis]|eukprot:XP_002954705.1 hypothetical protein VOLCADRAFT_106492 [Volvox carteri f. nagariensis]